MRETEQIQFYLDSLLTLLSTPLGLLGLIAFLCVVAAVTTLPWARWVVLTFAIYFASLPIVDTKGQYIPLAFPLDQLRQFARPLIYVSTGLLLLPLVMSHRGWRPTLLSLPLMLYFFFEVTICARLIVFGGEMRGSLSLVTYVLFILTLGVAVSKWLQTLDDLHKLIWVFSSVGGLIALGTMYQLAVNRAPIISGARLTGITGNPQFLGIVISYTLPFTCYLLTRRGGRAWVRPMLIVQVSVVVVMLLWTGSRTGGLSTAAAILVAFHRRLGRFLIAGAIAGGIVLLILPFFEGSGEIASRLLSTEDTRSGVLWNLLRIIQENFWFGQARDSFETQESSYLAILGQFGIIGALPFLAAAAALFVQLVQMHRLRRYLGPESGVVDIITGVWAAVFISCALEALLLGVITYPILMIYLFFGFNAFLLDWCRVSAQATPATPAEEMRFAA